MHTITGKFISAIALSTLLCGACERNTIPCSEVSPQSAAIPVVVDWSESGLSVAASRSDDDDVHRLSLRLFPTDGGEPFERYLERDLNADNISVPVGSYSVVAINESVDDSYWSSAMTFTDTDSYENFSAELLESDSSATEAIALAAWAIESFEVTEDMARYTWGVLSFANLSEYEQQQMVALEAVVMMPRTRTLKVNVSTTNLGSSQKITASVVGLSTRINIVTGEAENQPTTHTFELNTFDYSATRAEATDSGTASGERLCFSHSDDYDGDYHLSLEVVMNDGSTLDDEEQLSAVDVADQITSSDSDYTIEHEIELPVIESGSISLDDWADGGIIELM